jgi:hypothetical protein
MIIPTAQQEAIAWRYTFEKPADGWFKPDFDASGWKEGPAGFGTQGTPGVVVRTRWDTSDIWIRRTFQWPQGEVKNPGLLLHHDEDAEVYLNGVLAARLAGFTTDYEDAEMSPEARAALRPGPNVLAIHCHQTTGGQYLDAGIADFPTK